MLLPNAGSSLAPKRGIFDFRKESFMCRDKFSE
jgi:hypothetical protein